MTEHVGEYLRAQRGIRTDRGKLSNGFQEVLVSVSRVSVGEKIIEFRLRKYGLNISDIVRVGGAQGCDGLNRFILQTAD